MAESEPGDWKPRPDPTVLTANAVREATELLRREMRSLYDNMAERLIGAVALVDARLGAIEKTASVFEENLNRVPTALDLAVGHLKELHEAKLAQVQAQLVERDVRYSLVSSDAKSAVADALAAQKESVFKQDTATQKAIDQQSVLLTGISSGLGVQIADLKDRVGRTEASTSTALSNTSARQTSMGQIISWIIAAAAVAAVVLDHLGK